ncbi:MAG: ribosomal protein L13e [Candidatus Helarchaeota archaeon]
MTKARKKQMVVVSVVDQEKTIVPLVKSPSRIIDKRMGRGFSIKEIKAASIPFDDFSKLNLRIDRRRKTIYDSNVEFLGKKYRELIAEDQIEKEALDKIEKKLMESINNLSKIPSISKKYAKKLVDAGVKSVDDLIKEDPNTLAEDIDEKVSLVNQWIKDAKKFKKLIALDGAISNLCQIEIINQEKAKRLAALGIVSIDILAEETPSVLAEDVGVSEYLAEQWIKKAKELTKKVDKKKKVAKREEPVTKVSKKPKIKPKDLSLKDIGGIGKKELRKLQDIEITTLKQLAEEDPLEISSIIGVGKDQVFSWINKARELLGMPSLEKIKKIKKAEIDKKAKKVEEKISEKSVDFSTLEEELEEIEELETKEIKEDLETKFIISQDDKKEILKQLNKVKGIGKMSGEKLINGGIRSIQDLIEADIKKLSESTGIKEDKLEKFVEEAKKVKKD